MPMKFGLDEQGTDSVVKGLSKMFQSAALGGLSGDLAQQKAQLAGSQIYAHNMTGNKAGAQAEQEQFTLGQRKGVDDQLSDPALQPYYKNMLRAFKLTGDTNAKRVAEAGSEFQGQAFRDQANENIGDTDLMNKKLSIASGKAYMPFDNIGTTGTVFNKATGDGKVASDVLDKLFGRKTNSEINAHNAAAGNSSAHARLANAQTDKVNWSMTPDEDGAPPGKPLTNAQLRANEQVDAARKFLADVPRDIVAKVMNKSEFDLTPQDKDLLGRIKMGRTPKFGEKGVPNELNDMLGLDRGVVQSMAGDLAAPPLEDSSAIGGVISTLFGRPLGRKSEKQIIEDVTKSLPDGEKQNIGQYIAAAKAMNKKGGAKNPDSAPAGGNMPSVSLAGNAEAESIKADYKAGKISRDQAKAKLQQLGK